MLEHRFAKLTIAATFLLLLVGGTVNPTGSSLACPEPTMICRGELFPAMQGGVLYEHGHRLVAMSVGFLQIALTVLLWRRRPALRGLGVLALAMVCAQGALGAITVQLELPWMVSTAHLATAMAYLALLLVIAWRTRRASTAPAADIGRARGWIAAGGALVLAQIVLGGLVRHRGGALACVDLPLCGGELWPAGPLALKLHMAHRIGGAFIGVIVLVAAAAIWRASRGWPAARALAIALPVLVAAQVALGLLVVDSFRSVPVVVAHFGGASLLWGTFVTLWLMTGRLAPAPVRERAGAPAPIAGEAARG